MQCGLSLDRMTKLLPVLDCCPNGRALIYDSGAPGRVDSLERLNSCKGLRLLARRILRRKPGMSLRAATFQMVVACGEVIQCGREPGWEFGACDVRCSTGQ